MPLARKVAHTAIARRVNDGFQVTRFLTGVATTLLCPASTSVPTSEPCMIGSYTLLRRRYAAVTFHRLPQKSAHELEMNGLLKCGDKRTPTTEDITAPGPSPSAPRKAYIPMAYSAWRTSGTWKRESVDTSAVQAAASKQSFTPKRSANCPAVL
jgi:hypothetical protein